MSQEVFNLVVIFAINMKKKTEILYNKFGREDLEKKLKKESFERVTVSFYRYVLINQPIKLRNKLYVTWNKLNINGRIYIAKEGINAQLSCPKPNWKTFIKSVHSIKEFKNRFISFI